MFVAPQGLPIEEAVDEIRARLSSGSSVVLEAEPGAGKSTVLPLHLLDEPWLDERATILMLEPRRLAARAIARRMASLLGERVGETIGLVTRDDRSTGRDTRLIVMTEGVLTRRVQRDPGLEGVGLVIFDEFHERNLQADLGLAFCLEMQRALRPDLRIITMSATIDTAAVSALMGGCASVSVPGRTFPVETRWRPRPRSKWLDTAVAEAVGALRDEPGDILVFLPGAGEINAAIRETARVANRFGQPLDLRPLFGGLPTDEQDLALAPSESGRRKVVFATDIAETSLTVEGVRCVVDSGLRRTPRFDARTGMSRLTTVSTSRASADQRAGRAGRTEPGVALRLWSKVEHAAREPFTPPEIVNTDLASFVLELAAWGVADAGDLALLDHPPDAAIDQAGELLMALDLLDEHGRPTTLGNDAVRIGVHPRLARMLLCAEDAWLACVCAALIEERDVLRGRRDDTTADMWTRVQLVDDPGHRHPQADGGAIKAVRRRARQLCARIGGDEGTAEPTGVGEALAWAYPDRVAQARGSAGHFRLRNGSGAWLPKEDPLAAESFLVAADLDGKRKNARIRLAASIDPDTIEALFYELETTETLFWDDRRDDLYVRTERALGAIRFSEFDRRPDPSPEVTARLIDRARASGLAVLSWDDAARALQRRTTFVAAHLEGWPDLSDEALAARADELLLGFLLDATGRADLEALDVSMLLQLELGFDRIAELDRLAPATFDLPGGRPVKIDYDEQPRISAKAQRFFGLVRHPSVLDGAVPLVVELLSPADRPIQVTTDIIGFWEGSWTEVRKDMAGRYPKHDWPENPRSDR